MRQNKNLERHSDLVGTGKALVTIAKIKSTQRLVAVDAGAKARGLHAGMTLADARAIIPGLLAHPADIQAEEKLVDQLTDWCRRFTPLAAQDHPDGIVLDITGAAHLFGGEAKLIDEIEARLAAQGFNARAAIAPTPEAAWALARFSDKRLLPDGCEKDLQRRLGALPLAALRLDPQILSNLAQAGLRRIDDILFRPRAPLTARFGKQLFWRLDAALGRIKTPITPRFEIPAYMAERRFADPIVTREAIEATLLALAQDLAQILTRHGEGARRLALSLFRVDGDVKQIEVGTSRPLRAPHVIARLFHEKFESTAPRMEDDPLDIGYGFDVVRLSALSVERQDQDQTSWLEAQCKDQDLADLLDRLGARFGLRRVTRLVPVDTHWPEFSVTSIPAAKMKSSSVRGDSWGAAWESETAASLMQTLPERPIRLLQYPEPIETLASVPDGPPLRFRWRRVLHEVAAVEGPERIALEWWRDSEALTRDYFRAEDTQGRRFWLFREGLYVMETESPRWFMHGLFA
jgi:protein ImuB